MRAVHFRADAFFRHGIEKTGPTGAGIELGIGAEQFRLAADAAVNTVIVQVPILAGEGWLCAFLPCDVELLRSELLLPFGLGFVNFFHTTSSLPTLEVDEQTENSVPVADGALCAPGRRLRSRQDSDGDRRPL